jgi:hypothetical protein
MYHETNLKSPSLLDDIFSPDATAMFTDLTEARPLILIALTVRTPNGGYHFFGLVDCPATLDFVLGDFVRRVSLPILKYKIKTLIQLANGHCLASSTVCEISFEMARHEFLLALASRCIVLMYKVAICHSST